jgi:C-terminal processing protease CtpA/Prc
MIKTQATIKNARRFPLRILVENKQLVVLFNDTPDNETIRPGMEITEFNGHPASEIIRRIWPTLSGDGDIETGKWRDIGERFSEYYWLFFEQADEFTVKAKDATGMPVVAELAGVTDAERRANHNPANDTIHASITKLMDWSRDDVSTRFLKDPEIAEIRIGHLTGDDFPKRVEDTFRVLREKGTKDLIIDLRGSGGGDDMNVVTLLSYLTNKPFRYIDHVDVRPATLSLGEQFGWSVEFEDRLREYVTPNPAGNYSLIAKMHPGLTEQTPGKYPFTGKLLVLTDGGTFSGSADFCAVMHHLKRATFIGEETGGGYYGNSSGKMPTNTLPHSGLQMRLPVYGYWNAVPGYDGKRRGTLPDYVVKTRITTMLRGFDEQLHLALKLADR